MKIEHQSDYRARRVAEYPNVPDQIDAIYKGLKALHDAGVVVFPSETVDWLTAIAAIKAKLPKGQK